MRPNDWFKLACRILGLWWLLETAGYGISIFNIATGFARIPTGYSLMSYLVQTIGSFVVGIVLLAGASIIADFFYPDSDTNTQSKKHPDDSDIPNHLTNR
jgi:hypothetical protein